MFQGTEGKGIFARVGLKSLILEIPSENTYQVPSAPGTPIALLRC